MSQSGIITCRCGFIADNTHPYVAGVLLDNDLDFKVNKITKNNDDDDDEDEKDE